jgi:hypothetical protein
MEMNSKGLTARQLCFETKAVPTRHESIMEYNTRKEPGILSESQSFDADILDGDGGTSTVLSIGFLL